MSSFPMPYQKKEFLSFEKNCKMKAKILNTYITKMCFSSNIIKIIPSAANKCFQLKSIRFLKKITLSQKSIYCTA